MSYLRRLAYGTAKTIVETLKLGDPYANLKKVYSISLLYFDVSHDGDDYIYHGKTEFTGFHTHNPVTLKNPWSAIRFASVRRIPFPSTISFP